MTSQYWKEQAQQARQDDITEVSLGSESFAVRSVRMDLLDGLVLDHLEQRLFQPERLGAILSELIGRARNGETERKAKRKTLEKELREADAALRKLYELVERGLTDLDETLRNRLSELKQRREETLRLMAMTERELSAPCQVLTPKRLEAFSAAMQHNLRNGESAFRKSYLRLFVERIEVDDVEVRIFRPKGQLERGITEGAEANPGKVPAFVPDWRPQRDSNPCYQRERLVS